MTKRYTAVLVILDGLGDRPLPELNGQTPLGAAKTPTFDRLAKDGQLGLMDVIGRGITPGSDTAHLALFGYDPVATYSGRGPLEALGAGLPSRPGDVAFRANFATVDDDLVIIDRRAGRDISKEEGKTLQDALDGIEIDGVKVHFKATVEHRGALVLEGKGLSGKISDTDPHETGVKVWDSSPLEPEAKKTAEIVNKLTKLSHERFKDLDVNAERIRRGRPAGNILLLRGPGQHENIPTMKERFGVKSAVIAGGALYIGTAKYVGMEHVPVEGQTGTIDTNFDNIADKVVDCIKSDFDFVFVHIKATDNASHDQDFKEKILAIEKSDKMLSRILEKTENEIVVAVTGDHSTPVSTGEHTCDPVPVVFWSHFMRSDSAERFSEYDAMKGGLQALRGTDILPLLLGYAGLVEKFGA
ncbi:MAG: 2,3-bisphosphoglycerate-independent phosphoglycerate mutase [Candidatus Thorarchaeota archaeon]